MPSVYRITAYWQGFGGAPGYSRFAFQNLIDDTSRNAAGAAVRTMFNSLAVAPAFPAGLNILVLPNVDEYDMTTGVLIGAATMSSAPTIVTSSSTSRDYVAGAGFVMSWNTGLIFNGHRVVGRTFIAPAWGGCFETDGSLTSGLITAAQNAGAALCSATPEFSIWSKQYSTTTPPVQIAGAIAPAISCTVKDRASGLRSRRT